MLKMPSGTADVYRVLIKAARDKRLVTYGEVGKSVDPGLHPRAEVPPRLGPIFRRCRDLGLPPLTAIVVRQRPGGKRGLPGTWFWDQYTIPESERKARWGEMVKSVFAAKWPDDFSGLGGEPLLKREPEEELIAKLDRLEEIWLAVKRIEEELQRIRAELARRAQLGS